MVEHSGIVLKDPVPENLALENPSIALEDSALKDLDKVQKDAALGTDACKVDKKEVNKSGITPEDSIVRANIKDVDRSCTIPENLALKDPISEDLVSEDSAIVLEDLSIAVEDLVAKNPILIEDLGIEDDLQRLVVKRQRLTKQVVSLFSFRNTFYLLFSFSKLDTITATWTSSFFISTSLSSISTSVKWTPLSFKYLNVMI